jgi:hypothetical protein
MSPTTQMPPLAHVAATGVIDEDAAEYVPVPAELMAATLNV